MDEADEILAKYGLTTIAQTIKNLGEDPGEEK
jgi:hypothetical protein